MNRKVTLGPELINADLGSLQAHLEDVQSHGAPDEAKVRISTTPDGTSLTVNVEYDEEA